MLPTNQRSSRFTFGTAGPPRPGHFLPNGAPKRVTSRGMNDAIVRAGDPPRFRSRSLTEADFMGYLTDSSLSLAKA
ncbi:hypothetical protein [Hymenobacter terrenus]|uniref:hypothetical protein n=1 Tax=Hymenobacter terrenus TaxID=1629124 RepID=UPI0006199F0B|nr:hypothetical protein [Hymenobacter terrenus]